jgi:hypothetical protein
MLYRIIRVNQLNTSAKHLHSFQQDLGHVFIHHKLGDFLGKQGQNKEIHFQKGCGTFNDIVNFEHLFFNQFYCFFVCFLFGVGVGGVIKIR